MSRQITAISINTNPKRYVEDTYKRPNNEIGVTYTENKDLAMDFDSEANANAIIPTISNPHERIFRAETITVTRPRRIGEIMSDLK